MRDDHTKHSSGPKACTFLVPNGEVDKMAYPSDANTRSTYPLSVS